MLSCTYVIVPKVVQCYNIRTTKTKSHVIEKNLYMEHLLNFDFFETIIKYPLHFGVLN